MTNTTRREDVAPKIRAMIAEQLHINADAVTSDATLISLGADSLDVVEMVMHLEELFDIEITDAAAEKLHTVQDLVEYVLKVLP